MTVYGYIINTELDIDMINKVSFNVPLDIRELRLSDSCTHDSVIGS